MHESTEDKMKVDLGVCQAAFLDFIGAWSNFVCFVRAGDWLIITAIIHFSLCIFVFYCLSSYSVKKYTIKTQLSSFNYDIK